jgi:hypothetical protein
MRLPLPVLKISSTPSPMLLLTASDEGTHILGQGTISQTIVTSNFNITSLPDGMQSFRGCTARISTV